MESDLVLSRSQIATLKATGAKLAPVPKKKIMRRESSFYVA